MAPKCEVTSLTCLLSHSLTYLLTQVSYKPSTLYKADYVPSGHLSCGSPGNTWIQVFDQTIVYPTLCMDSLVSSFVIPTLLKCLHIICQI